MTHIDLPPWNAPRPHTIPDTRLAMLTAQSDTIAIRSLGGAAATGRASALPADIPAHARAGAGAGVQWLGTALMEPERERLANAHLYHVTADMCALANAVGSTAPKGAFSSSVAPTPYGFVVFDEPVAATEQNLSSVTVPDPRFDDPDVTVDVPIVAASWGPLSAPAMTRYGPWASLRPNTAPRYLSPRATGTWITFYTPAEDRYSRLPPHQIVTRVEGHPVTAREMAKTMRQVSGPLAWENEIIMADGDLFAPDHETDPTSPFQWVRTMYATWQMMRQEGSAKRTLTESHHVRRPRAGARRDQRAHVDPATSTVRVVDVHHRPSATARARDVDGSSGRRPTQWKHRWQVPPYWRHTCKNPRAHADGGCEHEDSIVPWHVKGDPHLPLKPLTTVRQLSDVPPSQRKAT